MLSQKPDASAVKSENGCLRQREIAVIEAAIRKIGAFGEVHLVIEHGRIRFVRTIKSEAIEETKT